VDQIPAGSGTNYTTWGKKGYVGLTTGMIVQSIVGADGSTPAQVWVGFNKQPPVLFNVRDAFRAPAEFTTIEIYNNSGTDWTVSAVLFDGKYNPVANSSITIASGFVNPAITSQASLQGVSTVGLPNGTIVLYVDTVSGSLVGWQLRADVTGTPAAGKVVPSDWNAVTNPHSWFEVI
jgi:hypothetical protein